MAKLVVVPPDAPKPEPEQPEDFRLALELAGQVATWNALTPSRTSLTPEDREKLAAMQATARRFITVSREVPNELAAGSSKAADSIVAAVHRYTTLCGQKQTLTLGSERIETEALESPSVRSHVAGIGNEIADLIASYIELRKAAVDREEQRKHGQGEQLTAAMQIPLLAASIDLFYVAMKTEAEELPNSTGAQRIERDARNAIDWCVGNYAPRLPKGTTLESLVGILKASFHNSTGPRAA